MSTEAAADTITATLVPEDERMNELPSRGLHALNLGSPIPLGLDMQVFSVMDRLSASYSGGVWDYWRLSNGGFFMSPRREDSMTIRVDGNFFEGEVSPQAAGIIATLFGLNWAMPRNQGKALDTMVKHFDLLRDYAFTHEEADAIFAALD